MAQLHVSLTVNFPINISILLFCYLVNFTVCIISWGAPHRLGVPSCNIVEIIAIAGMIQFGSSLTSHHNVCHTRVRRLDPRGYHRWNALLGRETKYTWGTNSGGPRIWQLPVFRHLLPIHRYQSGPSVTHCPGSSPHHSGCVTWVWVPWRTLESLYVGWPLQRSLWHREANPILEPLQLQAEKVLLSHRKCGQIIWATIVISIVFLVCFSYDFPCHHIPFCKIPFHLCYFTCIALSAFVMKYINFLLSFKYNIHFFIWIYTLQANGPYINSSTSLVRILTG